MLKLTVFLKSVYHDLLKDFFKIIEIYFFYLKFRKNKNFSNKTILINNQYHEDFSWLNYMLGIVLKKRGYNVKYLICSGNSYCERMTHNINRPNCNICYLGNTIRLKAFGHEFINNNDYFKESEISKENTNYSFEKLFMSDQPKKIIKNLNISKIFNVSFLHYFKGNVKNKDLKVCNKIFYTSIKNTITFSNILEKFKPTKIFTINGKTVQTGSLYNQALIKKINCYTWDFINQDFKLIFSKNKVAHEQQISDEMWKNISIINLSVSEKDQVKQFMERQIKFFNKHHENNYKNLEIEKSYLKKKIGIKNENQIISIFPNLDHDSSVFGIGDVYENLYQFLEGMIELSNEFKNYNFVLRTHPGGLSKNKYTKSTMPLNEYINCNLYSKLRSNFYIINPEEKISSYSLAHISKHRIVYSSTLGLEFPYMRLKTIVASNAYYKYKGFSIDPRSHTELVDIIKKDEVQTYLNDIEYDLVEKFIFLSRFRRLTKPPFFNRQKFKSNGNLKYLENNNVLNNICDFLEDKNNFLDLDKNKHFD